MKLETAFVPSLSVAIITLNEAHNLPRTLESVKWADEIIVVDSGSSDGTQDIARSFGAKVYEEPWKGFAAQKNSAIEKATCDWILSLDADEVLDDELAASVKEILRLIATDPEYVADESVEPPYWDRYPNYPPADIYFVKRKNLFLGRWIRRGGYYPDRKPRLFRKGITSFEDRAVHEDLRIPNEDCTSRIYRGHLLHHAYPTLAGYIEHMNKYSSLGAEMAVAKSPRGFSFLNIIVRPHLTFFYNYFLRLGFLDGREGLLLHLYHAVYVSWKYAKAWELSRNRRD